MNGSIIKDDFELDYIIEGSGTPLLIMGDTPALLPKSIPTKAKRALSNHFRQT